MSNIIVQGNEINAKQYIEKITIEGIGEEKTLNPRIIIASGGDESVSLLPFDQTFPNIVCQSTSTSPSRLVKTDGMWSITSTNYNYLNYFLEWMTQNNVCCLGCDNVEWADRNYIFHKIIHGDAKKIKIDMEILEYGDQWVQFSIGVLDANSTINVSTYGEINSLKACYAVYGQWTSSQINSQEGIVINSQDPKLLSRQVVEFDISGYDNDLLLYLRTTSMKKCRIYSISLE